MLTGMYPMMSSIRTSHHYCYFCVAKINALKIPESFEKPLFSTTRSSEVRKENLVRHCTVQNSFEFFRCSGWVGFSSQLSQLTALNTHSSKLASY